VPSRWKTSRQGGGLARRGEAEVAVDLPPGAPLPALGEKEAGWKVVGVGAAKAGVKRWPVWIWLGF
jgi:hypothetical protein